MKKISSAGLDGGSSPHYEESSMIGTQEWLLEVRVIPGQHIERKWMLYSYSHHEINFAII